MAPTSDVIDVDALTVTDSEPFPQATMKSVPSRRCQGYQLAFPAGQSSRMLYPFALHHELSLPWDYESCNGVLRLRARTCLGQLDNSNDGRSCAACIKLEQESILAGIEQRANEGIHENTIFAYYGFGGLTEIVRRKNRQINDMNLRQLTIERMLLSRARALDDYKRLIWQIGHGNFTNVERLIRVALKRGRGIKGILDLYEAAARGVYHPKSFTEDEEMLAILFWRLGGIRLAEIAHRALGLPGMTTIRGRSTVPPIIASYGRPSLSEIEKNIAACFEGILSVLQSLPAGVVQVILMFDELAIEKRLRWDHSTNMIMGPCQEHSYSVDLEFKTSEVMDEVFKAIDDGEVHYASEVIISHSHIFLSRC